jgi:hypothetical protein
LLRKGNGTGTDHPGRDAGENSQWGYSVKRLLNELSVTAGSPVGNLFSAFLVDGMGKKKGHPNGWPFFLYVLEA